MLFAASDVRAQVQESRMSDILNPDRNRASDLGTKTFVSTASVGSKRATTRPFAFGNKGAFGGRDGSFQTRGFSDRGKFGTGEFATRADRASSGNASPLVDKSFATKALPVDEAAAAHKSAPVRAYLPADKSIVIRGKRQDDLDDLYHQQNLSIDQVRQILNKPGSGMDAPTQTTSATPVRRALPVTAPAAQ